MRDNELRARFLEAMSRVAAAVTVATTDGDAGRFGVTVSSMTSVSADTERPSLLISVHHLNPACEAIRGNGRFCANVLGSSQSFVSDLFSGRLKHLNEDRFGAVAWHPGPTGSPVIKGAIVSLDCELRTELRHGTHFVFIGEAVQIEVSSQRSPLVYANRGYRRAIPISPEEHQREPSGDRLRVGFFVTLGPRIVPGLVEEFARRTPPVDLHLLEADHDDLVEQMHSGRIEAAITFGTVDEPGLEAETVCPPHPHVMLAAGHPLAGKASVTLGEVADLPMVLLDYPSVRAATEALFARAGHVPHVRFQSPSFAMVRGLVARDLGFSIVPQPPRSRASPDGREIAIVPLVEDFPEAAIVAVTRKAQGRSGLAQEFLARCRTAFRPG